MTAGPDTAGIGLRHLLSTEGLRREQAEALLDTAASMEQALTGRAVRKLPTLRGRTVVTLFYENSTRTRVSFEVAGKWMSADTINVSASGSSVGKGESLRDTASTLAAAGADAIVVRHPASGAPHRIAGWLDRVGHSHTDGHVAYLVAGGRVLVTGDSLITAHPTVSTVGPQLISRTFDHDPARTRLSVETFTGLDADVIFPGHGPIHHGTVRDAAREALAR